MRLPRKRDFWMWSHPGVRWFVTGKHLLQLARAGLFPQLEAYSPGKRTRIYERTRRFQKPMQAEERIRTRDGGCDYMNDTYTSLRLRRYAYTRRITLLSGFPHQLDARRAGEVGAEGVPTDLGDLEHKDNVRD